MTAVGSDGERRLEFGILGPLEVLRSGTRLKLGGRQQRAILGLLLCEAGQVVSIGRLADALWGEHLPSGFLTTVQTYIFHLRALLEPDRARGAGSGVLVTEAGGGYRLHAPAGAVDAVLFEDLLVRGRAALERQEPGEAVVLLDRALGLWRGEVLGDLADFGFVAPVSGRLQELRLSAMELRMEAELALGHHGTAVAELDRLVADHPLREQLHAERILALYRSGRQSDALAAYRQLRATLAEELGIEPTPPLHALHSAVLAQDPALAWHPMALAPVAAVGSGIETDESHTGQRTLGGQAGQGTPAPLSLGGDDRQPRRFVSRFGGSRRRLVALWAAAVLVVSAGSIGAVVWLARSSGPVTLAANSVGAVEPDGSVSAAVPVGTNPSGLAFGGGSLWVANRSDGTVSRIDPDTHTVIQTIDVGAAPESVTVTAGDVWVANFGDDTVSRINIATNKVVGTIDVGTRPAAIGSGSSGVWVANNSDNTIQRIDPVTDKPGKPVPVGAGPDGIAVGDDSVWVANGRDGTVSGINPKTGDEISSPIAVGSGPKGIAISGKDVWVANQLDKSVTRINVSTGVPRKIFSVGEGPASVAVANGAVWVSEEFEGSLTRIDPATDGVQRFWIGSSPRGLAAADGRVWVASGAFTDPKHSGGTLTVAAVASELPGYDSVDPAVAYYIANSSGERLVYDGLVAFRLASALDSQTLVPDLAIRVPQPSNGGKTYTFTLRPDLKYSNGGEIHASDFELGVRRALTLKGGRPDFFNGIIGGQNCMDHPKACDLSRGVVTDDATRRVTFRLSKPDPEFLYKLTLFVYPTPPGTSLKEVTTPLPGTGPYMIVEYVKGKEFTLSRNPFFRQWSYAAQPAGYPNVIRWLAEADERAALNAVISGSADVAQPDLSDPGTLLLADQFKVSHPGQVKTDLQASTSYWHLNVTLPPFNNLKARQAVNYAVDRNHLVKLWGGPSVAEATCQLLPPKFPGYKPHCPYTTGPADGSYDGPDLVRARKLVDESGTKGMPVTIPDPSTANAFPDLNAYLKEVLDELGYKATLRPMPDTDATWDFWWNPHSHAQVRAAGWGVDFPLTSNFYDAVVECGGVANLSEYCNRELDERAATAVTLMASDPGEALRAWPGIDRTITDQALIVPMFNPKRPAFVSARVDNYYSNQALGPLLSQLWVR